MAKHKAPKGKQSAVAKDLKSALPCLVIVLLVIGGIMMLFYWVLKSSS